MVEAQVVHSKKVEVVRVVVHTVSVERGYAWVELEIDGHRFEMDRPAAQVLGQILNRMAGGVLNA